MTWQEMNLMSGPVKMTIALMFAAFVPTSVSAQSPGKGRILVCSDQITHSISPLTTGACLEDVNHEVYGGIYSQMVFGESFEEPPLPIPIEGFIFEGPGVDINRVSLQNGWMIRQGILCAPAGEGPKLLAEESMMKDGEVSTEILFEDKSAGVAGLIVKVNESRPGADSFSGYEISLDPEKNQIIFGKHRQNWEPIRNVNCSIAVGKWITLKAEFNQNRIRILVDDQQVLQYMDPSPLSEGLAGFRTWNREAQFRNFQIKTSAGTKQIGFQYASGVDNADPISKMWTGVRKGNVNGGFAIEQQDTFNGRQSQRMTFKSGNGLIGISNSGLNRRGMQFLKGREYEGILWLRADHPSSLKVSLEDRTGTHIYAQREICVADSQWQRFEFTLISSEEDANGRFCLSLTEPGSVVVGYAFLQPGPWGRFNGLPVRLDVAEKLVEQKLTVLRYGGCMANASEYRWKKMIGPRDLRPPYKGWWYPYSSNGWGIIDFINFCEAAGFEYIPNFNIEETPEDIADFVEYIHGGTDTVWGQKRAADGHPETYKLKYIQIGNEESVDAHYLERFKLLAAAIWSKNPEIIPVVGDFAYNDHISDPYRFSGAPRIRTLEAHREILRFAKANNKPVWFDVHIWNDDPRDPDRLDKGMGMRSFVDMLGSLSDGADFKVCVFEENAVNHTMRRALAHAHAINEIQRYEHEVPILCAANCLQPDGQNDNGWDQGLLFLNQSKAWGQPSYYVTQMISDSHQPLCVQSFVDSYNNSLDVTACKSLDGKTLSLRVVNLDQWDIEASINLAGFVSAHTAEMLQIKGRLNDSNTADESERVVPVKRLIDITTGKYTFPAYSFTVINFKSNI